MEAGPGGKDSGVAAADEEGEISSRNGPPGNVCDMSSG